MSINSVNFAAHVLRLSAQSFRLIRKPTYYRVISSCFLRHFMQIKSTAVRIIVTITDQIPLQIILTIEVF